jgi:uncharacterized membrane protein YdcZ (DUF606 family)
VRYGLKEDSLARVLVEAVGINAESASAKAAKNWYVTPGVLGSRVVFVSYLGAD